MDRPADLETGTPWKFGVSLLSQHSFDGANRDFRALLGEQPGYLTGRQPVFLPGADLGTDECVHPASFFGSLWHRLGEVDLVMGELMSDLA